MTQAKQKNRKFTLSSKHILPIAFVLAFVCGAVMMGLSGYSPIAAYGAMLEGCFGNLNSVAEVLLKMIPLLLAALGLTISSRAQVISIGSEGQIYLGALGAAAVGLFYGRPAYAHRPAAVYDRRYGLRRSMGEASPDG